MVWGLKSHDLGILRKTILKGPKLRATTEIDPLRGSGCRAEGLGFRV